MLAGKLSGGGAGARQTGGLEGGVNSLDLDDEEEANDGDDATVLGELTSSMIDGGGVEGASSAMSSSLRQRKSPKFGSRKVDSLRRPDADTERRSVMVLLELLRALVDLRVDRVEEVRFF